MRAMAKPQPKQKIYCYVDESGQDTEGLLFLVTVVVASEEREVLIREAEKIEQASGKSLKKWHRAEFTRRVEYIKAILSSPLFTRSLFFAHYTESKAYLDLTVYATARAILQRAQGPYKATVVVDGLSRTDVPRFARGLRALHIAVHKVRGTKDESDALIRLADALAGFVRDYLAEEAYARELYRTLHAERVLKKLP
jgi:uncharacterized protein DUF3800